MFKVFSFQTNQLYERLHGEIIWHNNTNRGTPGIQHSFEMCRYTAKNNKLQVCISIWKVK